MAIAASSTLSSQLILAMSNSEPESDTEGDGRLYGQGRFGMIIAPVPCNNLIRTDLTPETVPF